MRSPRLRTVEKYRPPFPLNEFPSDFPLNIGREIVYLLATRVCPRFEGQDWEEVFARCIHGRWKPSNVGLDDILLEQTAWSAKTVKNSRPSRAKKIRLISGRNSPFYSFEVEQIFGGNPDDLGRQVLSIWNERVASIRAKYQHLRTVVMIKSEDLLEVAIFEFDTIMYLPDSFRWKWNVRKNLEGIDKNTGEHRFTWQPHGAQFTIVENVPKSRLALAIKEPPHLSREDVLGALHFDPSWITILK